VEVQSRWAGVPGAAPGRGRLRWLCQIMARVLRMQNAKMPVWGHIGAQLLTEEHIGAEERSQELRSRTALVARRLRARRGARRATSCGGRAARAARPRRRASADGPRARLGRPRAPARTRRPLLLLLDVEPVPRSRAVASSCRSDFSSNTDARERRAMSSCAELAGGRRSMRDGARVGRGEGERSGGEEGSYGGKGWL